MASRRDLLKGASGALLAATGLAANAQAQPQRHQVLYGNGLVWNRALPGLAGELLLTFYVRADMQTGTGFGTCSDSVHSQANTHFSITGAVKHGNTVTLNGVVIQANDPANLGQPVKVVGVLQGEQTSVAIQLGGLTFQGSGRVVIAIIAILIGL